MNRTNQDDAGAGKRESTARLWISVTSLVILIISAMIVYVGFRDRMLTVDWTILLVLVGFTGGVLFYVIDPQSKQSFVLRKVVNLSGAAAIGGGFMFLAHWLAMNPPEMLEHLRPAQIVLLDSPDNVYDDDRRSWEGTNSDEIKGILATLPNIEIRAIRCNPAWSDEQSLLESVPDLIIMHHSTFRNKDGTNDYRKRLYTFLKTLSQSERTKFIVYSRKFTAGDNQESNLGPLLRAAPRLKGRLEAFYVEKNTFMAPETASKLRNSVRRILGT